MKKIFISIGLLFALTGCGKEKKTEKTADTKIQPILIKYSFEDVIKNSNFICTGTLKSKKTGTNILDNNDKMSADTRANYTIFTFNVTSTLYDSYGLNKTEINVYTERNISFESNKEYFLPVSLVDYAYFVEDIFTIPGVLVLSFTDTTKNRINVTDEVVTKNGINYSKTFNKDELLSYVSTLDKGVLNHYTKETNKEKIVNNSPIILKIKIGDLAYTRDTDYAKCETFVVEILDVLKGKQIETSDDIKIEFVKGSVKKGDIIYAGVAAVGGMVIDDGTFYGLISTTFLSESDINN